ncbi:MULTISPECIES: LuxR C-terminal-related transcriptional regulator [unclassified Dysgonomonas]|uniref:LuxR C-terminal-related transcriptional regulator n=1 Tax=unclassified Dysgonomonas TaxID=2630389 RepID=UPI0024737A50|nr:MULTISPECIES: LuxR C-terminal-related transcriptional regulator [unclassified Dysgonomonas]
MKNDPVYHARVQYLEALILLNSGGNPDVKKVDVLIDQARNVLSKDEYPAEYAKTLLLKSILYVNATIRYAEAYKYLNETIELFDDDDDAPFIALAYNHIGALWAHLGELENAIANIKKAENIFTEAGYNTTASFVRSNSYGIQLMIGNPEKIIPLVKKDLFNAESRKDTTSAIFLNIVLGNSLVYVKEFDSANIYLNKAYNLISTYSAPSVVRQSDVLYYLGKLFYLKKDYDNAILYIEKAMPYIKKLGLITFESNMNSMLSDIYKQKGDDALAYKYLKQSVALKDSLALTNKMKEVQRIKSHTELKNYQQQIQITEQQAKIKKTQWLLISAVLTVILLIIVFSLLHINKERKLKELKIIQLDQELKNKEINNRLEKMEMERQMEEKEREIATSQLLVSEKSKMLEQLLETLKPLYKSKDISDKVWRKIKTFTSSNLNKESGWEKSKFHFEKVHPDFFKNLKDQFPQLTENELRLCAYIRIGMRTKDIAEMLSIDPRSVITNRYHLKKKMNLGKEQTIDDFIRNI